LEGPSVVTRHSSLVVASGYTVVGSDGQPIIDRG
jgi:hypothetical protein